MSGRRIAADLDTKDPKNGLKKLLEDTLARATKDRDEQLLLHTTGDILYDLLRSFSNRTKVSGLGFSFFDAVGTTCGSEIGNERKILALFKLFDELEARAQLDLYELGGERAAYVILGELQQQLSCLVKAKKTAVSPSLRALALQKVYQFKVNEQRLELPSADLPTSCFGPGFGRLLCWSSPELQSWETVFGNICKSKTFRGVAKEILAAEYPVDTATLRELQLAVEHVLKASVETPVLSRKPFVAGTPSPLRHNADAASAFATPESALRAEVPSNSKSHSRSQFSWSYNAGVLPQRSPFSPFFESEDMDTQTSTEMTHTMSFSLADMGEENSAESPKSGSSSQGGQDLATARSNLTYDEYAADYSKSRNESLETLPSLRLEDMTTPQDTELDVGYPRSNSPDSLLLRGQPSNSPHSSGPEHPEDWEQTCVFQSNSTDQTKPRIDWEEMPALQSTAMDVSQGQQDWQEPPSPNQSDNDDALRTEDDEVSFWSDQQHPSLSFSPLDVEYSADEAELLDFTEADDDDDDEEYDDILLERLNSALAMYCLKKNRPLRHSFLNTISEEETNA